MHCHTRRVGAHYSSRLDVIFFLYGCVAQHLEVVFDPLHFLLLNVSFDDFSRPVRVFEDGGQRLTVLQHPQARCGVRGSETKHPYSSKALVPRLGVHHAYDLLRSPWDITEKLFGDNGICRALAVHKIAKNLRCYETDREAPILGHLNKLSVISSLDDTKEKFRCGGTGESHRSKVQMLRLQTAVENVHHEVASYPTEFFPALLGIVHVGAGVRLHHEVYHGNTHGLTAVDWLLYKGDTIT